MNLLVSVTLRELHHIREKIAQEQEALSNKDKVEHTRKEAEVLLKV